MRPQYDNDEVEIDLKELFFALLTKWKYILFSALFIGGITAIVNQFVLVPQYASTSKLYVLSKSTSLTSLADIQMGTSLTQDYQVIITGRSVVNEVNENLNLQLTYEELVKKVTVENAANTRILNITVTDVEPERAKKIADMFAIVSSHYIAEKMNQDAPNIIEYGYVDEQHVSPSKTRNTLLGVLAGGFLASALVIVIFILDDSIKNSEDIEKYLELHTLATVYERQGEVSDKKKRRRANRWKK